jgi:hypothetical protein
LRDTFRKEFKKVPKSRSGDGGEQAPRYLGTWPHFGAMLFLRSVITPRPTEGNIEDHDFPNVCAAAATEYDNEGAQFQEDVDVYERDSESPQPFQLNASSNQSV